MTRALIHIAMSMAMFLGLSAEGRAFVPAAPGHGDRYLAVADTTAPSETGSELSPLYVQSYQYGTSTTGTGGGQMIPPSVALQVALNYSPGSQGLGVRLLQGARLMYAVKLKTGNRVHRVLVDAHTGQVLGE